MFMNISAANARPNMAAISLQAMAYALIAQDRERGERNEKENLL